MLGKLRLRQKKMVFLYKKTPGRMIKPFLKFDMQFTKNILIEDVSPRNRFLIEHLGGTTYVGFKSVYVIKNWC